MTATFPANQSSGNPDHQIDRLALALSSTRSRRGLVALGAAAAALAAGSASAAGGRHGRAAETADRPRRAGGKPPRSGAGISAKAAAASPTHAIPVLDPRSFAGNPALNEFNLLMNRLIRNLAAWRAAIAAPVPAARRKQVAALGASIADDLGRIARYEKTLAAGRSVTWAEAAVKFKALGAEEEFRRRAGSFTLDEAITRLTRTHGPTIGGVLDACLAARPAIAAVSAYIRRQAAAVGRTGMVSDMDPEPLPTQPGPPLPSCADINECVMLNLVLYGYVMAAVTVAACVILGPAAPQCIGLLVGFLWWLLESLLKNNCGLGAECRQ